MHALVYPSITSMYGAVLKELLDYGEIASPRGKHTREITGASFTILDSRKNVLVISQREPNYFFSIAEWLWMVLGQNDEESIVAFNSVLARYANEGSFDGAYGPKIVEQLPYVIGTLRDDPDSRQAVLNIWRERPRASPDVPCTLSLQFLLRRGALRCVATMRSNDAWRGLPYDVFNFTQIQAYIAAALGVRAGSYTHNVGSLHLYESDVPAAETVKAPGVPVWHPVSPDLTYPMPAAVRYYFNDIARRGEAFGDLDLFRRYAASLEQEVPKPWSMYLKMLLLRWARVPEVDSPWDHVLCEYGRVKMSV